MLANWELIEADQFVAANERYEPVKKLTQNLFKAADAELPLHLVALVYEGNRKWVLNPC